MQPVADNQATTRVPPAWQPGIISYPYEDYELDIWQWETITEFQEL